MKSVQPILLFFLLLGFHTASAQLRAREGKGFFNITNIAEPGYLQSIDSSALPYTSGYIKKVGFSMSTINGVFLNRNLSVGLGVGVQFTGYKAYPNLFTPDTTFPAGYLEDTHSMTLLPLFADFRYYPGGFNKSLLFILDVGYASLLGIKNDFDKSALNGGPLVKLGAAYRISLGETASFVPSLNFNAQRFGDNTALGGNLGIGFMF